MWPRRKNSVICKIGNPEPGSSKSIYLTVDIPYGIVKSEKSEKYFIIKKVKVSSDTFEIDINNNHDILKTRLISEPYSSNENYYYKSGY